VVPHDGRLELPLVDQLRRCLGQDEGRIGGQRQARGRVDVEIELARAGLDRKSVV